MLKAMRSVISASAGFAAVLALSISASTACAETGRVQSWDWQLTGLNMDTQVDFLDVEPDMITGEQVAAFKAKGTYMVCYVSVGTREDWRDDFADFPDEILGERYQDWPDETFLDVRRLDILLPIMRARFERCAALGFDAIEPDNMDVHWEDTGFDYGQDEMRDYVIALAKIANELGLGMGQKNTPDLAVELVEHLDFALFEGCVGLEYCDAGAPYVTAGKPVLNAEYGVQLKDQAAVCETSAASGVITIFKQLDLDASGTACPAF